MVSDKLLSSQDNQPSSPVTRITQWTWRAYGFVSDAFSVRSTRSAESALVRVVSVQFRFGRVVNAGQTDQIRCSGDLGVPSS
uniref:Uncharacterized protein n=1 Tax=Helianthus annuus TaxID=4232 RepID=A0A251TKE2_HELAN